MKKTFKRLAATLCIAALVLPVLGTGTAVYEPTSAMSAAVSSSESREEIVYANLGSDGTAKEISVVTILHNSQAAAAADYGSYASVKNLTDTTPITLTDDAVTLSAPKGDFYYQGQLKSTALPWNISITYYLDGIELPASELAGKAGHIEIKLGTTPNTQVDASYYDNYLLQVSVTLDASRCANIEAAGGTIANAGKNKLVTYAVMPGNAGNISLDADVTDFSMAGISLAAVPLSMKIDSPDTSGMLGDLTKLSDAIAALNDGIGQLKDGTAELNNGAADLKSGSLSFAGGLNELYGSSSELIGGSAEIMNALYAISSSMNGSSTNDASGSLNLNDLAALPDGLSQLAAGLDKVSLGLIDLKSGFSAAYAGLDAAVLEIPDSTIPQEEIAKLYQDNPDKKGLIDKLMAFYSSGSKVKGTYLAVKPAFDAVGTASDQLAGAIGGISGTLTSMSTQIKGALESNDTLTQMRQLSAGLAELSSNYNKFHEGLVKYTSGVSLLKNNYGGLNAGIAGIAGGVDELYGGISQTYDGTAKLNDGLKDMPSKVDEEINKLLNEYDKSDFKPVSFVSDKNDNTVSVQFILKTEKIEVPEIPAVINTEKDDSNIWTRFLDLFR